MAFRILVVLLIVTTTQLVYASDQQYKALNYNTPIVAIHHNPRIWDRDHCVICIAGQAFVDSGKPRSLVPLKAISKESSRDMACQEAIDFYRSIERRGR